MTTSLADALPVIRDDRVVEFASAVTRARQPAASEGERAEVIADLLSHPRVDLHVDPVLPGRPNVIARVPGLGTGPGLLLNAHLDARYIEDGWTHDPHDPWLADGKLHGGAVTDMLGGLGSMMATIEAVATIEPLPGDVVLLANMHHDSNGLGTKYALASDANWPRFGINGEPTGSSILTIHGGCVKFEIDLIGRPAHVSRSEDGIDALSAAVDIYQALRDTEFTHKPHPDLESHPRFVVGVLRAGTVAGDVADRGTLQGDVRTVPGMDWFSVRADLERAIARAELSGVAIRINCLVRQRPFVGPISGELFDALRAGHHQVYGTNPDINVERAAQGFVTDASDMAEAQIETLVYGPGQWYFRPDEAIDVAEMSNAARVYLATAYKLMGVG